MVTTTPADAKELLTDIRLPVLLKTDKSNLDKDITEDDMEPAIQYVKSGKALGPNGIPVELFKMMPSN